MSRYFLPLSVFVVMAVFLGIGLTLDPKEVPSPFIGKPAPEFSLPRLDNPQANISPADMKGQVWLLNVWATWCVSCRAEHPTLVSFSRQNQLPIVGLNYKDDNGEARRWLQRLGNPYYANAVDADGRVAIDWGVYGAPETFVIDKKGIIRYKQIGPVTPQALSDTLLPLIEKLKGEAA
ncbi:MAG: DsbE family thiol:disulfide interchange protein [Gammaproteobacteria bacterium]|nr:DsbE family thiol:disulfide interchange protein [Gammaproteobacteria bacterium]